jgi:predicted amidohydrolase YtcJ
MTAQLFVGGKVWTAGFAGPRQLEVLVRGDRIAEVSRPGEIDVDDAEIVDLSGAVLLPGFQDAHIHPGLGGRELRQCNLLDFDGRPQIEAAIEQYATDHPQLEWIIGGGWSLRAFAAEPPTRELLDRLVGGRRAVLQANSRHTVWASSAALRAAGIDETTPDPEGGRIERHPDGQLTGLLHEQAMTLLTPYLPADSMVGRSESLLTAQTELLRFGVTSMQDALVGTGLGFEDFHATYVALLQQNSLQVRVTTALWWDPFRGTEQISELRERRRLLETVAPRERVIADTVKIMVDGADVILMNRQQLFEATAALDQAGFTVHYHSYGEASTQNVLDAIEAARKANPASRTRHHIAHLMVILESDFARFGALNVSANIQGFWGNLPVYQSMLRPSQLSCDPHRREYAFSRLLAAGARLAAGSDWPVSTANPLDAIRVVTHQETGAKYSSPDELDRLDLPAMLEAYTAGSAYVNGRAETTGRIAPGFLADLVVLKEDFFYEHVDTRHFKVEQTWIDGRRLV